MATQAISNLSIYQELQNFYQDRGADLRQLGHALQAGDMNQAQQVYEAMAALGQSGPFANAEPFAKADRAQAFEALGQTLASGNLADSQDAFAHLQQLLGNSGQGHISPAFILDLGHTTDAVSDTTLESIFQQRQEFRQQRRAGLEQLGTALQAGDAETAQQAYEALVALGQNGPFRNGKTFQRPDRAQEFEAIGQALQSGDLQGALQAFTDLISTFGHRRELPPGPPTPVPSTTPPPSGTLPPTLINPGPIGPPVHQPPSSTGGGPVGPPVYEPPSSTGGGPDGPPEIIVNIGGSGSPPAGAADIVVNLENPTTPETVQINFGDNGASGQVTVDVNPLQDGSNGEQISIDFNPGSAHLQLILNLFHSLSSDQSQAASLSLQA